jgi:zinc protease
MISTPSLGRTTLPNGLRVVVAPNSTSPVVAVSVHYDVGFRSEPEGFSGFAHLFEHMMFGGSESVKPLQHSKLVQSVGGYLNGSTAPDYTVFWNVVPTGALDAVLFLESDRMRAPRLAESELGKQVNIIEEEIRSKILDVPYGNFPQRMVTALFDSFANTHDGYGDFASLRRAGIDDCAEFFDKYYTPSNAVLTIAGDVTVEHALALAGQYFDDIPARPAATRVNLDEPASPITRRVDVDDPTIPLPAISVGYRMPNPVTQIDDYLAVLLLADVLTTGDNSRLQRRMTQQGLVYQIEAGPLYGAFFVRDPDALHITTVPAPGTSVEAVLDILDAELDEVAQQPPTVEEIDQAVQRWTNAVATQCGDTAELAKGLGLFELLHGEAELLPRMPARAARVTPDSIASAAKALRLDGRGVYTLQPGQVTA